MKDDFYRDSYRNTLKWVVRMLFVTAILSITLFWMTLSQKQPAYYAAMTTGRIVPIHSLSEPVITGDFIVSWSELTARRLFNLSFVDYQDKLSELKDRFTPGGWNSMQAALSSSGMIKNIVDNKLIMSSVVVGNPVILARMIINGRFTWRVQMQMLVKFTSASEQQQENYVVAMDIERVPTLSVSQGIQITKFTAKLQS